MSTKIDLYRIFIIFSNIKILICYKKKKGVSFLFHVLNLSASQCCISSSLFNLKIQQCQSDSIKLCKQLGSDDMLAISAALKQIWSVWTHHAHTCWFIETHSHLYVSKNKVIPYILAFSHWPANLYGSWGQTQNQHKKKKKKSCACSKAQTKKGYAGTVMTFKKESN